MQILLKQCNFKIHWVEATLGFPFTIIRFPTTSWLAWTLLPWQGGNTTVNLAMLPHPKRDPASLCTCAHVLLVWAEPATRRIWQDGALLLNFSLFPQTSHQKATFGDKKALRSMKIFSLTLNAGPNPTQSFRWLNSQPRYKKLSCFPRSDNWDSLLWFLNTQMLLCLSFIFGTKAIPNEEHSRFCLVKKKRSDLGRK